MTADMKELQRLYDDWIKLKAFLPMQIRMAGNTPTPKASSSYKSISPPTKAEYKRMGDEVDALYKKFDQGLRGAMYEALHVKPADRKKAFQKLEPKVDTYIAQYDAWSDNAGRWSTGATARVKETLDALRVFLNRAT